MKRTSEAKTKEKVKDELLRFREMLRRDEAARNESFRHRAAALAESGAEVSSHTVLVKINKRRIPEPDLEEVRTTLAPYGTILKVTPAQKKRRIVVEFASPESLVG